MKSTKRFWAFVFYMLATFALTGCSGNTISPEDAQGLSSAFKNMAVAQTGNPEIPFLAIHESGDLIAILADVKNNKVKGAVYAAKNDQAFTVWTGQDNLPNSANSVNATHLFGNYRDTAVDAAIVNADSTIEYHRNLAFAGAIAQTNDLELITALKFAAGALKTAACISAAIYPGNSGLPCDAQLLNTCQTLTSTDLQKLQASAAAFEVYASSFGCVTSSIPCTDVATQAMLAIISGAEETNAQLQKPIERAVSLLAIRIPLDNLIAYYPFTANAEDKSGKNNHGVINGPELQNDRFGQSDCAYGFDGATDFIEIPNNHLTYNLQAHSVASWFKWQPGAACCDGGAIFVNGSSIDHYGLFVMSDSVAQSLDSTRYFAGAATLNDDAFHHVVTTYDGQSAEIWLDGTKISSVATDVSISYPPTENSYLGVSFAENDDYFKGVIDEVAIYDRALTAAEIQSMFDIK
jgi:hypothetical protein